MISAQMITDTHLGPGTGGQGELGPRKTGDAIGCVGREPDLGSFVERVEHRHPLVDGIAGTAFR